MFKLTVDDRLSTWIKLRSEIDQSNDPLQLVWDFWHQAPFVPHKKSVDPFFQRNWPTPWEIIVDNKYDDFTKALMISWTLKLTKKFENSKIFLKTYVDSDDGTEFNLVFIDDNWVINYNDNGPVRPESITKSFRLQNLVEVNTPR